MLGINLSDFLGESKEIISETVEVTDRKIHVVLYVKSEVRQCGLQVNKYIFIVHKDTDV